MSGRVRYTVSGGIAEVLFDRPDMLNAMSFSMYEELETTCRAIRVDPSVRVAVFRGVGGKAFVAGTDIQQFLDFHGPQDGVAYEERIDRVVGAVEAVPVPTIAVVEGFALGGGFALATVCDLRIATPKGKFGYPIARTVGNCLSVANVARLVMHFGPSLASRILLLAETIDAKTAHDLKFVMDVVHTADLESRVSNVCDLLKSHAPLTLRASKEMIRRVVLAGLPDVRDLIEMVYGSADFRHGVESFLAKKRPGWSGQ
jgi:enoyl-CoA hydratase